MDMPSLDKSVSLYTLRRAKNFLKIVAIVKEWIQTETLSCMLLFNNNKQNNKSILTCF